MRVSFIYHREPCSYGEVFLRINCVFLPTTATVRSVSLRQLSFPLSHVAGMASRVGRGRRCGTAEKEAEQRGFSHGEKKTEGIKGRFRPRKRFEIDSASEGGLTCIEPEIMMCTWLGERYYFSYLPVLHGPAWVLLSLVLHTFITGSVGVERAEKSCILIYPLSCCLLPEVAKQSNMK